MIYCLLTLKSSPHASTDFEIPHGVGGRAPGPEPLGGLMALLGGMFDDQVDRIYVRGGLLSYRSALEAPHVYLPHDVALPGALTAGDVADLAAALAPRQLRFDGFVDALNRPVATPVARREFATATEVFQRAGSELVIDGESSPSRVLAGPD